MNRIQILWKPLTATTVPVQSDLVSVGGYLVYSDTIGGGVVTDLNVREFLDSPNNIGLATSFFNFLNSNTVSEEFNAIFYNNQKLANTFNDFYNKTTLGGDKPNRKDVTSELSGSSAYTYSVSDFLSGGTRSKQKISVMTFINTGHSYYIPVEITLDTGRVEASDFSRFHKDSFGAKQAKQETLLKRYAQNTVVQLPNPANAPPSEYQSFQGPLVGRDGVTAFKFKLDKYISESTVPAGQIKIDLIFQSPIPTTGQTIFILTDPTSTANFGTDFDMNDLVNPTKTYKKFYLNPGQTGLTTNIRIFDSFKKSLSKSIILTLSAFVQGDTNVHGSNVMVADNRPFTVINKQPSLPEDRIIDVNEAIVRTSIKSQKLLQGFVDYNFDDSESEFWRNSNVVVIKPNVFSTIASASIHETTLNPTILPPKHME
jgi:hypothetical protein